MSLRLLVLLFSAALASPASAGTWSRIFLDERGDVHLVQANGKEVRVSRNGKALNPKLAPDGKTAAWLVGGKRSDGGQAADTNELTVYRHGHIRKITCDPLIRDFWFWRNGAHVALDCGGRHFAGRNVLYDLRTFRLVESVDQATVPADRRPEWTNE